MKFEATSLPGLVVVEMEPRVDERGYLARTYCEEEFAIRGLNTRWPQCNATLTRRRGTIRGLHYQAAPHPEIKLIRCTAGAVWDVVVDLRPGSVAYGRWEAFELTVRNGKQLYVPAGCAHGFQCIEDDSQLFYQMSDHYRPELACGVRWNDPTLAINWPRPADELSPRDRELPSFDSLRHD